jgi:signal peptidase I
MNELQEQAAVAEPKRKSDEVVETPLESLASICTVLAIGLFLMTFVFQNYVIPSGSMESTLLIGDHVFVDRMTLAPPTSWAPFVRYREVRRGDVIVFMKPNAEIPDLVLVKRAIGIPGDKIHLEHGIVYLNGKPQDEPYAHLPRNDGDTDDMYQPARDDFPRFGAPPGSTELWAQDEPGHLDGQDLVVPAGKVFAMGDNREHSLDGRFWGFVPRENIMGRPMFNYWSFESAGTDLDPSQATMGSRVSSFFMTALHFFDKTRWSRTLHLIK